MQRSTVKLHELIFSFLLYSISVLRVCLSVCTELRLMSAGGDRQQLSSEQQLQCGVFS